MRQKYFVPQDHDPKAEPQMMEPLPLWKPNYPSTFKTGMMTDAPFVVTNFQQRSDLGDCCIAMRPPYFVAKIHAFQSNHKNDQAADKHEYERRDWIDERKVANVVGDIANKQGISTRELIEESTGEIDIPKVYDDEKDEPRTIAKVPGLNIYLELLGCLEDINAEDVQWGGFNGALATLSRMSLWMHNNYERGQRRQYASFDDDPQPLEEWQETYDETVRFPLPRKSGVGVWPNIDPSRRPELLHCKTSLVANPGEDIEGIKLLKSENARLAAEGYRNDSLK